MHRSVFLICFLFFAGRAEAQFGNEWINFGQPYLKVQTAKDGIYRITYSDLQNAGFPMGSDPRRMQLFHRGVEQAILLSGQSDAKLDPGDYLEFYGRKNDGTLDAGLYQSPSDQPHQYYNLTSDTTAYFLTVNPLPVLGKRMADFTQVNISGIPKETFHNDQQLSVFANEYCGGYTLAGVIQYTRFDEGEGWTGSTICVGNSGCTGQEDFVISNLLPGVPAGGVPHLDLLLVGRDELGHQAEVYVGPNPGALRLLSSPGFLNFEAVTVSGDLAWSDIGADGNLIVRVKALGVGGARDRLSVSYVKLSLPQNFDMNLSGEKWFHLAPNVSDKSYVEIINAPAGARIWDITDENNILTIGAQVAGSIMSAVVPSTSVSRTLLVSNTLVAPVLKSVSFRQINPAAHNYLVISHPTLMQPALGYSDPVRAYAGYRASAQGGGYDTLVVTSTQLYDQFSYGEVTPLSIYQFMKYMTSSGSPKYLFLIGKGRDISQGFHRKATLAPGELRDLVPTAGTPPSDMAFTAGLNGTTYEPGVPTGRYNASTAEQVASYLNKVKEMESLSYNVQWRKEGLHLSGGIKPEELTLFRQYMDGFKTTAEGIYWGGKITTLGKYEPNPVQLINISDEVNKGLNIVTFFGHAAPNATDIDIGYVTDPVMGYNNPGKYPVFLVNGCNVGSFFSNLTNFAEDWMLATNKGSRAFMAHSSYGFSSSLQAYTDLFYNVGFADSTFIEKGLGDIQKEVARRYLTAYGSDIVSVTQVQQVILLGDPALTLFGTSKPDYEVTDPMLSLASLDGQPVTALSDSFAIRVIVKNLGAVKQEPLLITLTRKFTDNTTVAYDSVFYPVLFQDTLLFKLRQEKNTGFGNNEFTVVVDSGNKIDELNENNNSAVLQAFIPSRGTKNLFPAPFSIVNSQQVNLLWQNTDLLAADRDFQIELDTSAMFSSPFLISKVVSGKVLASLMVSLLSNDSLVYYWRTRFDKPQPDESQDWVTTSFAFINNGPEGWVQKEFPQFIENATEGLVNDPQLQKLKFNETAADIFVKTFGSANPTPYTSVSVKINNAEYNLSIQGQPCRNNTINIIPFNKSSSVPYAAIPFNFVDPRTCGRVPQLINSFTTTEIETGLGDDLLQVIDNIGVSDSFVMFSIGNAGYTSWSANVITKLGDLGIDASQIAALQAGEPVVIFGKKGAPAGTAKVFKTSVTPANEQEVEVSESITGRYTSGNMASVLIGPAKSWSQLLTTVSEIEGTDIFSFSIMGVKLDGTETLLLNNLTGNTDLSAISAVDYPYLKLKLQVTDDINQTPVQLKKWLVAYEAVAEGLLLYNGPTEQQHLAEGQSWAGTYRFVNISGKAFPAQLTAEVNVVNTGQGLSEMQQFEINAPAPGDSTVFSVMVNTKSKAGLNDLNVFVNRKIVPEQYFENNTIEMSSYLDVKADDTPPVLDVSVDGRYLQDGDVVSSSPFILVTMKDENQFLFKTDTVGMNLLLSYPCEQESCSFERINLTQNDVKWFPATDTSDFRIEFTPQNLPEGKYTLSMEVQDATGNKSGAEPYKISFQVKTETMLEMKEVFPNPSSANFFFRFLLTGNVLPDYFSLQIFTPEGRMLQEFGTADAQFHIGTNELMWEARDLSGNALPNGLYIYRLTLSSNGQQLSKNGILVLTR